MVSKKNIIFDTDIGVDCDDITALSLLCAAHNRGDCRLMAVTSSVPLDTAAGCALSVLGEYGIYDIPVYNMTDIPEGYYDKSKDVYAKAVYEKFGSEYIKDDKIFGSESPVRALRRLLAASAEKVTLLATGPLHNIGRLLESEPDDISPLDGVSLVKEKAEMLAIMGGNFENTLKDYPEIFPEWNIRCDIENAQVTVSKSPVKTVFLSFEAGFDMITGGENVKKYGKTRPSSYGFIMHGSENGRHSWDPATALYAVYGEYGCFEEGESGNIEIGDNGVTRFLPNPTGKHHYLRLAKPKCEIAAVIDRLLENDR